MVFGGKKRAAVARMNDLAAFRDRVGDGAALGEKARIIDQNDAARPNIVILNRERMIVVAAALALPNSSL